MKVEVYCQKCDAIRPVKRIFIDSNGHVAIEPSCGHLIAFGFGLIGKIKDEEQFRKKW